MIIIGLLADTLYLKMKTIMQEYLKLEGSMIFDYPPKFIDKVAKLIEMNLQNESFRQKERNN